MEPFNITYQNNLITVKPIDDKNFELFQETRYLGSIKIVPEDLNGFEWKSDDVDESLLRSIGGLIEDHYA